MKKFLAILIAAASFSSYGGVLLHFGTTVGGPTWQRLIAGNPPTTLSGLTTNVAYDVLPFSVDQAGSYIFQVASVDPAGWDNYTFLYQSSFDPTDPFTNVLVGNDDNPTIGLSGFIRDLAASTPYVLVTTGFGNGDQGAYTATIYGPGNITSPIPEPASWALAAAGVLALALSGVGRRRRARPADRPLPQPLLA